MIAAAAVVIAAVVSARANRAVAQATQKNDAGQMALSVAMVARAESHDTKARLDAHEAWREELVMDWWPEHKARDTELVEELQKLDPTFSPQPWPPLPKLARCTAQHMNGQHAPTA